MFRPLEELQYEVISRLLEKLGMWWWADARMSMSQVMELSYSGTHRPRRGRWSHTLSPAEAWMGGA
jgi:hypothetical protein